MDLIDNRQTELCISTPPIWQGRRISNIQVHRQVVYIVSLGEYKDPPIKNKRISFS